MDFCKWDFDFSEKLRNPNYNPPHFDNDSEWLVDLYKNILNMEVNPDSDKGHAYWTDQINKGFPKEEVLKYFKKVASDENSKINNSHEFEDFLGDEGPERRIAVVMPESAGDVLMMNSLMENLKKLYPDHNIYFITKKQFFPLIEDNPYVFKIINYQKEFDNLLALEGRGDFKGYFDVAYLPHIGTQKILTYVHNGKDKLGIELYEN